MITSHITKQYGFAAFIKAAALVSTVGTLGGAGSALGQEARGRPFWQEVHVGAAKLAELEDTFWRCDYRATTGGVASTDIATCIATYDALKEQKFGGDFYQLLFWWRQNKVVQHGRLALVGRP
jgi:hypothetical protein